jgi:D-sedoheptulose 7-phosphate isomerase
MQMIEKAGSNHNSHASPQAAVETNFTGEFLTEVKSVVEALQPGQVDALVEALVKLRARGGRLFILGVGGGAGNASHAVNDFRKIGGFEAYAPTDNVSELTARTNDEGWSTIFRSWLEGSRLTEKDGVLVFSVGGGNAEKNVSPNLVAALDYCRAVGAMVLGIVGRDGGHTAKVADACVIIPTVNPEHVTPHTEAFQVVIWHLLVSHPDVKRVQTKWESIR